MAKSRGRKFAELVAPTNGVFAAASIPTIALSKLASSTFSVNSESASLGGNVVLDSNDITEHTNAKYFTNARAQATLSVAANSGHGALAYDNSNGQFTFAGITTEAIQDVVGAQLATNGSHTGVSISYDDAGDGAIDLTVNDTTKVPLAGGTMTGNLTLNDNVKAYFGSDTDLQIYHTGINGFIVNSTGELRFSGSDFAIKSDSAKLLLGGDDDLQIYHNGIHSYIDETGTGNLYIRNGTKNSIFARTDGEVILYHNNSGKLATASTGVAITGLATMTTGTASSKFAVGTATVHASYAFYNNSTSYFNGAVTVDDALSVVTGASTRSASFVGNGIEVKHPTGASDLFIGSQTGNDVKLSVAGANALRLYTNSAERLNIAGTGAITFNNAFTFPTSDGSANQILQTDGSGAVSWVTNTGGTSIWSQSGSNIYYNSGNVGIGISSPSTKLDIKTANIASSSNFATKAIAARMPLVSGYNNVIVSGLGFYDNTIHSTDIGLAYNRNSTGGYDLVFSTNPTTSGSPVERMTINADGKVGIGTSNPGSLLDVGASGAGNIVGIKGGNYNQVNIAHSSNSSWGMLLTNSNNASNGSYHKSTSGENNSVALVNVNNDAVHFGTNNTHRMTIDHDGYVGIGTSDPANPLHIATSNDEKIILSGATDPYIRWQEGTTNKAYIQWNAGGYLQIGNQEDNSSVKIDSGLIVIPSGDEAIVLQGRNDPYIRWQEGTTNKAYIQWNAAGYLQIGNQEDGSSIRLKDALDFSLDGSTFHTIWHAGNDGAGSGLDADTLDGQEGAVYFKGYSNVSGWQNSNKNFSVRGGGDSVGFHMEESDGTFGFQLYGDGSNYGFLDGEWANWDIKKVTNGELYVDAGSGLQKVWHAGNDGAGSGLDADTLDTLQASSFLRSDAADSITTYSNKIQFYSNTGMNTGSGSQASLECYNGTVGGDAFMTFHVGGDYACYFGLDGGTNKLSVGGWSMGAVSYEIYHAGNKPSLATLGFTGASNANYITNNNQLTNGAGYLTSSNDRIFITDTRSAQRAPSYYDDRYVQADFTQSTNLGVSGGDTWAAVLTVSPWTVYHSGHRQQQLIFAGTNLYRRTASSDSAWGTTHKLWDEGNLTPMISTGMANNADTYMNFRVIRNSNTSSTNDGMYIGYANSNNGVTRIFGGGATTGGLRVNGAGSNDVTINGGTAWHSSNDGPGSGLNADLLDNLNSDDFARIGSSYGSYFSGTANSANLLRVRCNGNIASTSGYQSRLEVYSDNGVNTDAFMAFHVSSDYAVYFGLDGGLNDLAVGGWSMGGVNRRIFHEGNLSAVKTDTASTIANNIGITQRGQFTTGTSGQNNSAQAGTLSYDYGYQFGGAWSHPYPDLVFGYHTGMRFGGHINYGGCRFYSDHPSRTTTMLFSIGNGDSHVRANNNIYAYTSDKRLKENFRPIKNAVDKVKAIGGFIFDWRKDMMDKHEFIPDQEKDDAGLIAQEVQKVMPAAIRRAPFDYDLTAPNQSKSGEEFLTVQYEKMVPLLVEAIKEQQKQIDELKKLLEEKE